MHSSSAQFSYQFTFVPNARKARDHTVHRIIVNGSLPTRVQRFLVLLMMLQSGRTHYPMMAGCPKRPECGSIEIAQYEIRCECRIGNVFVTRFGRDNGHIKRAGRFDGVRIAGHRADETDSQRRPNDGSAAGGAVVGC